MAHTAEASRLPLAPQALAAGVRRRLTEGDEIAFGQASEIWTLVDGALHTMVVAGVGPDREGVYAVRVPEAPIADAPDPRVIALVNSDYTLSLFDP